jgi:hypothetical protein
MFREYVVTRSQITAGPCRFTVLRCVQRAAGKAVHRNAVRLLYTFQGHPASYNRRSSFAGNAASPYNVSVGLSDSVCRGRNGHFSRSNSIAEDDIRVQGLAVYRGEARSNTSEPRTVR